jgi:hypothetical protein
LRELVSNAWDANATLVRILTNHPKFFQLSVQDNGDGFSADAFESIMRGGIGNSPKRANGPALKFGRQVIGRLGIGLLGVAQICGEFTVTSRPKEGEPFKARIKLYDFLKERLDKDDTTLVRRGKLVNGDNDQPVNVVEIGTYEFEKFDNGIRGTGTRIFADVLHPTFIRTFQESVSHENYRPVPRNWLQAVKGPLKQMHSLQELGEYWRLLWELSAACPVPYLSDDAIPDHLIAARQKKLLEANLQVVVDRIALNKPVYLKGHRDGYTCVPVGPINSKVYGRELRFGGYIAVQEGLQLKPDELRGIMLRIKGVGIGYYDQTMLDYRYNQGPRSRWITGEVYIDSGLEDALNVDRDSFNRFHPEFRHVQSEVHRILTEKLFPVVYRNIDKRSAARQTILRQKQRQVYTDVIQRSVSKPVRVKVAEAVRVKVAERGPRASVVERATAVRVIVPPAEALGVSTRMQELARGVLAIFEVAIQEPTTEKRRQRFSELLVELLKKW